MMHFLAMGKYAAYVWPSYGVSLVGLAAATVIIWRGYRNAQRLLARAEKGAPP